MVISLTKEEELPDELSPKDLERWFSAFPSSVLPVSRGVEEDKADFQLAKHLCPQLYVDPRIFAMERAVLAWNLNVRGIRRNALSALLQIFHRRALEKTTDAIFNMFSLNRCRTSENPEGFTEQDAGAELWLLNHLKLIEELAKPDNLRRKYADGQKPHEFIIPENYLKERFSDSTETALRIKLLEELTEYFSKIRPSDSSIKEHISELFEAAFPSGCPTCVIKYNVVHHPIVTNLICVQYFFYWPIQIWPHHFFDYEPIYVYAKKDGEKATIIAASINSLSIKVAIQKMLFSFFRKRPGHIIRLFFNILGNQRRFIGSSKSEHGDMPYLNLSNMVRFDRLADAMMHAYSGKYIYEKGYEIQKRDIFDNLGQENEDHIALCIPNFLGKPLLWHSFDLLHSRMVDKKDWLLKCPLLPLGSHDLLHIEWDTYDPFKAPFLYPIVGRKNPLMHLPFDFTDLCEEKRVNVQSEWYNFCENEWEKQFGGRSFIYRMGKLIELLYNLQKKRVPDKLWLSIKKWQDYRDKR